VKHGALEYEGIGAGFHRRFAYALLVVDAEDDHLEIGAALPVGIYERTASNAGYSENGGL
jgi:hypothetical protein